MEPFKLHKLKFKFSASHTNFQPRHTIKRATIFSTHTKYKVSLGNFYPPELSATVMGVIGVVFDKLFFCINSPLNLKFRVMCYDTNGILSHYSKFSMTLLMNKWTNIVMDDG